MPSHIIPFQVAGPSSDADSKAFLARIGVKTGCLKVLWKLAALKHADLGAHIFACLKLAASVKLAAHAFDELAGNPEDRLRADAKYVKLQDLLSNYSALTKARSELGDMMSSLSGTKEDDPYFWLTDLNNDLMLSNFDDNAVIDPFRLLNANLKDKIMGAIQDVHDIAGDLLDNSWHEETKKEKDIAKVVESFNDTLGKIRIKKLNGAAEKLSEAALGSRSVTIDYLDLLLAMKAQQFCIYQQIGSGTSWVLSLMMLHT